MSEFTFTWTDGNNEAFKDFYIKTEEYYSKIVGGKEKDRHLCHIIYRKT